MRWPGWSRHIPLTLAILIAVYAALIRLDALVAKYGTLDRPGWAASVTHTLAPVGTALRPFALGWPRQARPYHGGDPINYLRSAREMESFYQGNVREPVFPGMTRAFLWLLGDQDVAVSFASLVGSVLAVFGTYLVAAYLMPPAAALAASLLVALDYDMITWSPDGWRDDTFTATVLWTAWGLLRVRELQSASSAMIAGVAAGIACLTRITALSFIVPGLIWLIVDAPRGERRVRLRRAGLSAAIAAMVIAPYLINCVRRFGDPLIAINYHTVYYRHGEGLSTEGDVSAAEYIAGKFRRSPMATIDTGANGIFVEPFVTKWSGLIPVLGRARIVLMWSAIAGLMLMPFAAAGRLLLVVLFTSLLPYAFTWNIGGGNAWRFTMHVYPLFIVAAAYAISAACTFAIRLWRWWRTGFVKPQQPRASTIAIGAAVLAIAIALAVMHRFMPWLVVREVLARGEDVNVETGPRDSVFYHRGWSPAWSDGVTVRVSTAERAQVRIPLPSRGAYDLVMRVDPVVPDAEQRLSVLFNGQFVARFTLGWNPERVGSYRVRLQPGQVRAGRNEVTFIPERRVPASAAGPRFAWLPPAEHLGIRLWYVRVLPVRIPNP